MKNEQYFRDLDVESGKAMDRRPTKPLFNPWHTMDSAPKDREIEVYAIDPIIPEHGPQKYWDGHELEPIQVKATYHPDAGFCVCEFRVAILWREAASNKLQSVPDVLAHA